MRFKKNGLRSGCALAVCGAVFAACGSDPEFDDGNEGGMSATGALGGTSNGPDGTNDISLGGDTAQSTGGASGDPSPTLELEDCDADEQCPEGSFCKYDVCLPQLGSCDTIDDCHGDAYCDADGACVPYGVDPEIINDPSCARADDPPNPVPVEQCHWAGGEAIDDIYTTPMVADLNFDDDPNKLQPSIVVTTFRREAGPDSGGNRERMGTLRIIDGRTCTQQLSLGDPTDPDDPDAPAQSAQLALGDLDADLASGGRPEIVGLHRTPGVMGSYPPLQPIAWKITGTGDSLAVETMWRGRICEGENEGKPVVFGDNWFEYGPALFDLNDDGMPEVVVDKFVFDNEGCIRNRSVNEADAGEHEAAIDALFDGYLSKGAFSTIADVDLDGNPELVRYDGVYAWNDSEWVLEDYADDWGSDSSKPGHIAVADMGEYSSIVGHPASDPLPEIIVVSAAGNFEPESTGSVRVLTLGGQIVFGRPIPTLGDDCDGTACFGGHGGPPTASDFDGDGQVEFAAAANVYYTVYDPDCRTGGVPEERAGGSCNNEDNSLPPPDQSEGILWVHESRDFSSSQTGSSIFDFNGDGRAEAVYRDERKLFVFDGATGSIVFSGRASSGTGSEYPTIVDVDGDFSTEIVYANDDGISILREPDDLWVSSRPIWNQHAYSITHVTDAGQVRRTSDWTNNWQSEGLNNFRQNTQGDLGALSLADLTVELDQLEAVCEGAESEIHLHAKVCNRGTNPVQDGAVVAFFSKPNDAGSNEDGTKLCDIDTETLLGVGDCTIVTCVAEVPSESEVFVLVDPDGEIPDCHPGNNSGSGSSLLCPTVR